MGTAFISCQQQSSLCLDASKSGWSAPTKNAVAAWAGVHPEATAEYVALQPPESVPRGEHLKSPAA
jgi:hypothetical protein